MSLCSNSAVLSCLAMMLGMRKFSASSWLFLHSQRTFLLSFRVAATQEMSFERLKWKKLSMTTASVVGFDGGKCKELADIPIHFSVNDMQISEDLQLVVGHMAMKWLQRKILTATK